jgi:alkylhydroperoxidase family enzyme
VTSLPSRVAPVPFKEWPPEVLALIPAVTKDGAPPREATQKAKNMIGMLAHHPGLMKATLPYNAHLLRATTLSERQRELVILRAAVLRESPYTWAEHVPMARTAGLDDEEIGRIAYGPDAPFWNPADAAVLRSVDDLLADARISDDTWAVITRYLDTRQLLDLIYTVGAYATLAMMIRTFGLEFDDDLRRDG